MEKKRELHTDDLAQKPPCTSGAAPTHPVVGVVLELIPVVGAVAYVPAAQTVQLMSATAVAAAAKNVPAGHSVETAALSAAAPAQKKSVGHAMPVEAVEPAAQYVPGVTEQSVHVASAVAVAAADTNLPAGHDDTDWEQFVLTDDVEEMPVNGSGEKEPVPAHVAHTMSAVVVAAAE